MAGWACNYHTPLVGNKLSFGHFVSLTYFPDLYSLQWQFKHPQILPLSCLDRKKKEDWIVTITLGIYHIHSWCFSVFETIRWYRANKTLYMYIYISLGTFNLWQDCCRTNWSSNSNLSNSFCLFFLPQMVWPNLGWPLISVLKDVFDFWSSPRVPLKLKRLTLAKLWS